VRNPARERSRNPNREVWGSPSVYGGEDVKEELKATYNDKVVYGLTDSSNVYIDAVSLGEVLSRRIYSKLIDESDRLWVSADDLAAILEDNNCPTDDFEKWLLSIRGMDNKTHTLAYNNDISNNQVKPLDEILGYEGQESVFSSAELGALQMKWPELAILCWAPDGSKLWVKPRITT
jgi:hypothetical protein